MKNIFLICSIIIASYFETFSQIPGSEDKSKTFYFDAVCFQNDSINKTYPGRIDIYSIVPYQSLNFEQHNNQFVSKYELYIELNDSNGIKLKEDKITRTISAKEYFVTQGGTAQFDRTNKSYYLNPGKYSVNVTFVDVLLRNSYKKSRDIFIVNFPQYPITMSGLMLLSSIEEKNGKYKITPHITDNVSMLTDGFFIFYEVYKSQNIIDTLNMAYEIFNQDNKSVYKSKVFKLILNQNSTRNFNKIKLSDSLAAGTFKIKLYALKKTAGENFSQSDYLAITERSIKNFREIAGLYTTDIDLAVRYLKFVANQSDIDIINASENKNDKIKKYEAFWKTLDPSPNTEKNEAMDEYYARIDYANKTFKTYTEGWMTDMGMTYVVYGPPIYIDQSDSYNGRNRYIKWTYANNKEFIFVDDTGIGDYKFARGYIISDKYKYNH